MSDREQLERRFVAEILRIVGDGASADDYAVAPDTSDALLMERIAILAALPSNIGHDELLRRAAAR